MKIQTISLGTLEALDVDFSDRIAWQALDAGSDYVAWNALTRRKSLNKTSTTLQALSKTSMAFAAFTVSHTWEPCPYLKI